MPFYHVFEEIFLFLQAEHNIVIVMAAYILLHAAVIALRLIVYMGYRGHNMWMASSRSLKSISDITSIRSGLLRRIVAEYVNAAEKNAPRVPLKAILDKCVLDLNFIGWRYAGISLWVDKLETGLIFVGIVVALIFPQYAVVYGLLAVIGFLLLKLSSAFFDYDTARQILLADIQLYVEREVGHFFSGHTAGAIAKFKDEVGDAIDRQSVLLQAAMEKLGTDLTHLSCLSNLPKAIENMQKSNDRYALHHEAFVSQVKIIKDLHTTLENSLASYESSLQNLVQTIGSGIGTYIQMHGQTAASNLTGHIARMSEINQETQKAITIMIEQLITQSRDISTQLRSLRENMDI